MEFLQAINPLTKNKILDQSKLKALADNMVNANQNWKLCLGRVENILGKEENACCQHFFLFPQCFPKPSSLGLLKVGIVW